MKQLTACPVCDSRDLIFAFSAPSTRGQDQRQWSVSECKACSHQFMNPQPDWSELEHYYSSFYAPYNPKHGSQDEDEGEIAKAKQTGKFRHIDIPAGKRLLDVGCGGGRFLRIAKKLGALEQGVEPSSYAAEVARKQGLNVFNGTLESYGEQASPGAQFDVITANHVLEHAPNPVEVLGVMKKLLASGGLIWIAVPNAAYSLCRALRGRWHSTDLPFHLMQFSPASLTEAGRRAGLVVQKQTTESLPQNVATTMRQYLRHRWMVPGRLTAKISLIDRVAESYAPRFDAEVSGEAIIIEFVPAVVTAKTTDLGEMAVVR
jgi:2-polyprenyl-3-methyl-5-hydroxy-6-metoxy-1,4-benzoquinol methylase